MKKLLLFMIILILAVGLFVGCSGGTPSDPSEVKGETFDGGNLSALVPDGWMGFNGFDYFEEFEEGYDPNVINIVKDAKSELDMLTKPYIMINYYADNTGFMSSKDFYEDAKDIEPIELGNYSWTGFTTDNLGYPTAILETTDGSIAFQVTVLLENNGEKISLDDADVQAIIASIAPVQ